MGYDDVLTKLGDFGRYQKRIYFLLCLPAISTAFHKLVGVFLQAKVPHRCRLPFEAANASYSLNSEDMQTYYPWDPAQNNYSSCLIMDNGTINKCHAWIYDKSLYESTTVMEWDLVCDAAWMKATSDALLMIGVMLGSIGFGDLSDRFGRRPIFFLSLVLMAVSGFVVALTEDIYSFMLIRLVIGSSTSGAFMVAYVLALEMVGPKTRMFAGVAVQLFFTTGYILTALFAYYIHSWRILQIAITLPGVCFLAYWWFIPESVRWLLTKGRYDEAKAILSKAAKENGTELPVEEVEALCSETELQNKILENRKQDKPSLLDLFKHRSLMTRSLIIFFLWFVNSGAYYGLSWNTSNLGGNEYLNFVIAGAVEVPAYVFLLFTLNKWGRKMLMSRCMIIAGVCLMGTFCIPQDMNWLNITLAMLGKLTITASYGTVYIFTAEQFPTVIRNVGMGAASTSARIGGILAPYINMLADYWNPLPLLLFGTLSLIGGVLSLVLPETLNRKLPDTIEDGKNFGREKKAIKEEIKKDEALILKENES